MSDKKSIDKNSDILNINKNPIPLKNKNNKKKEVEENEEEEKKIIKLKKFQKIKLKI